jgi:Tol biopolymer transport system component
MTRVPLRGTANRLSAGRLRRMLVLVTVGLGVTSTPAWAAFPGRNGRIAFASTPPTSAATTQAVGDRDIYTINPGGSGLFNLTKTFAEPRFNLEPDWSPDGTKVAFRNGRAAAGEIYTVNADGTGLTQLTTNSVKDYAPAWSPDGSEIAFASNRNDPDPGTCVDIFGGCNIDIFVMPASGGSPVQVTFGSGTEEFPEFSPDGRTIAYISDASGDFAVYTVDLATLATTKLTADSLRAGPPDYSPDGTKIAFSSNFYFCKTGTSDCKENLFVMDADGGAVTQLTHSFGNNSFPAWSPEGDKIAFTHSTGADFYPEQIDVMNADGTGITRITNQQDDSLTPDWGSR